MEQNKNYKLNIIDISTKNTLWLSSNKYAIKLNKIINRSKDKLKIYFNSESNVYLSYLEKNTSFSIKPKYKIDFKNETTYKFNFEYNYKGNIDIKLYVMGYLDSQKIEQYVLDSKDEKYIKFNSNCNGYRIAIKLRGQGEFELKSLVFTEIEDKQTYKLNTNKNIDKSRNINSFKDLNIISILDEFSYQNFSKECNLFNITPYDYIEVINKYHIDFLFIESAWKGKDGSWEYKIAKNNNKDKSALRNLINYCKNRNIPTVFWNKEDPVHFERFIDTAKLCDYVFTTDRNKVDDYKKILAHDNVFSMPFAAQPKIHNPIKKYKREKGIVFAGSYYENKHKDRKEDLDKMLDICKKNNLVIFDRNYEITKSDKNSPYRYPEKYQENIKGSLKYTEIDKAYKGFEVMLNVNTVKNSPTMFSRRVFEGLACGTPIISNYSDGISEYFKNIVLLDKDNDKLENLLYNILSDDNKRKEISILGIREILSKHTYEHRLAYMMSKLGINIEIKIPTVSFIVKVNSRQEIIKSIKIFDSMECENKKLVILIDTLFDGYIECINNYNTESINCYIYDYIIKNYKSIDQLIDSEYCCYINLSNIYGKYYAQDLILATKYTHADIIGKLSYYTNKIGLDLINKDSEYIYVNNIKSDRCIIFTDKLKKYDIKESMQYIIGTKSLNELSKQGISIFSIDNYNFIENGAQNQLNKYLFK